MYQVKDKNELRRIILDRKIPLETIDTSLITDMNKLFHNVNKINGSISNWNVSNVTNMSSMFYYSPLNQDLSKWDVSSVRTMLSMFNHASFNNDISKWNTSQVREMSYMFHSSKFNQDISTWDVSNVEEMDSMFSFSLFDKNISSWNISKITSMNSIFSFSYFSHNLGAWDLENININEMFEYCYYTFEQYQIDRKEYLNTVQLEKDKIAKQENEKYLAKIKIAINQDLNKDIILSSIELEF